MALIRGFALLSAADKAVWKSLAASSTGVFNALTSLAPSVVFVNLASLTALRNFIHFCSNAFAVSGSFLVKALIVAAIAPVSALLV